jgi:LAO/AO transport system kinase
MIETVGAGQSEVDIAKLAHTTIVVEAPGLGDDIQAIKAGILEIADILVVNKADRPGVEKTEKALKSMLELAHPVRHVFQHHGKTEAVDASSASNNNTWIPSVHRTVSTEGLGIAEVIEAIAKHRVHLTRSGDWIVRERARLEVELEALIQEALVTHFRASVPQNHYDEIVEKVVSRNLSPWDAVKILMNGRAT